MKRYLEQKYIWTDVGDFIDLDIFSYGNFLYLADLDPESRYTTYDYAVDVRSAQSDIIQELLK